MLEAVRDLLVGVLFDARVDVEGETLVVFLDCIHYQYLSLQLPIPPPHQIQY